MQPVKALWLCNLPLSESDTGQTGTWLGAMARGLLASGGAELGVIAPGPVRQLTRRDYRQVRQWVVPAGAPLGLDGLPPAPVVRAIVSAVDDFSPDLVHIWGTEFYWGLLSARGVIVRPTLLDMQGMKGPYARVFYGGLTVYERMRCIGIKELLRRRTMYFDRRAFARWGKFEKEMLHAHRFFGVQTSWAAAQVAMVNHTAQLFSVDPVLRQAFYDTRGWRAPALPSVFCTAAYPTPHKGLHVAIRALAVLRKRIPNVRLRIAGSHQRRGVRQDGYMRWINRQVRRLDLGDSIEWLGPLDAAGVVAELENAAAVVIPTYIENYCTAMQEAMAVGTPVVVSYVGGTPSLGKDGESCLFFEAGNETMCAFQLERVLTDLALASRLSRESRKVAAFRNDSARIVRRQTEIYAEVLAKSFQEGCN